MTRIDRYLLLLYFRLLTISFLSISGLLIVVHVFTNLDEFVRYADEQGGMLKVLVEYYGPYLIWIFEQTSGLLALMALLFVIAWLYKTNELTALLAAGIPKRRIVRPLMIASGLTICAAMALREVAIPYYQDRLDRKPQDLTGEMPRPMKPTFDPKTKVLLSGKHLLVVDKTIVGPNVRLHGHPQSDPLASQIGRQITAAQAVYWPADEQHPAGYHFQQVSLPANLDSINSIRTDAGEPLLFTSSSASWLQPGECFLVSDIEFELLRGGSWQQYASMGELITHLRGQNYISGDGLRVQIHSRLIRPLIDWALLLLGLPVLLHRPDRHMFWVAGICLGIVAIYTTFVQGFLALGSAGYVVSPAVAVWIPVVFFLPWGWARTASAMDS